MRLSSSEFEPERPQERRNDARHTLILRVGVLEQAGRCSLCLVKNISASGIQLKYYSAPTVGAPASIRVADEPAVRGSIAWMKDGIAGMQFDERLDAPTLLRVQQKLRPNRRRSMPRVEIEASATLRTGGRTCRAMVCDISSLGTRVRTRLPLTPGNRAVVEFPGLPSITAFVRWSDGEESGLSFESPIPMPIIARWIGGRVRLSA